jgi:hypothetical protein
MPQWIFDIVKWGGGVSGRAVTFPPRSQNATPMKYGVPPSGGFSLCIPGFLCSSRPNPRYPWSRRYEPGTHPVRKAVRQPITECAIWEFDLPLTFVRLEFVIFRAAKHRPKSRKPNATSWNQGAKATWPKTGQDRPETGQGWPNTGQHRPTPAKTGQDRPRQAKHRPGLANDFD